MPHIPKLFSSSHKKPKPMESRSQPSTPSKHTPTRKLDRKNAAKNINYSPSPPPPGSGSGQRPAQGSGSGLFNFSSSASTSSCDESLSIRNSSIDVYNWGDRTSFRIDGKEGELELLLETLGLSGPDDFGIDARDFEAMKTRSAELSGQLLFASGNLSTFDVNLSDGSRVGTAILGSDGSVDVELCGGVSSVILGNDPSGGLEVFGDSRVSSVILRNDQSVGVQLCGGDEVLDESRVSSVTLGNDPSGGVEVFDDSRVSSGTLGIGRSNEYDVNGRGVAMGSVDEGVNLVLSGGRSVGVGIRGERPPAVLLSPPPNMATCVVDHACSSWDILLSFGPDDAVVSRIEDENGGSSSGDEGEHGIEGDDEDVVRRERPTNSNDDDDDASSSTTTDPMSISPNGILRRRISTWSKGRHLGSGSFGSVYEGIADGGFFFAVKEVSLLDQGEKGREIIYQFEQEMAFLSQFEHNNIVRYFGTDKDDSNLYIFLELAPLGSLLSLYQRFQFQDSHVSVYTRQILEGLKYLHERNVVHRDIKCANILMDVDGNAKLADFGLAKVDTLNDAKSCKGTSYWMAPEVVQPNKRSGRAADIWSLGCTVLEMLTQNFPYHPMNGYQAMFQIGSGQPPPVPNVLSGDARDFILKCLQVNPETRPSAAELLGHPFVKKPHSASASPHHHRIRV